MRLIVDTNIILAALLKPSVTQRLLLSPSFEFFSAEYCIEEIENHFPEIAKKMGKTPSEIRPALNVLLTKIILLPKEEYAEFETKTRAVLPDPDDWPFLAVALKLDCPIWTSDKHFKAQKLCKSFTTAELMLHVQKNKKA